MLLHVLAKCPSCCITKNVLAFLIVPDARFEWRPLQSSQNNAFLLPLIVPLFTHEGQSCFGGLSENVLHILLVLCRTLEVELCIHLLPRLLALQSQSTRCVSVFVVFVRLDRLYVVVVSGLHASCCTDLYLHAFIPVCKWWDPDSGPWVSSHTLYPSWGRSCSQSGWREHPCRSVSPQGTTGSGKFIFLNFKFVVVPCGYSAGLFRSSN